MAKKRAAGKTHGKSRSSTARRKKWSANRGRTVKPNGGISDPLPVAAEPEEKIAIGEAIRRAKEALGDLTVDASLAPQQLRELGELCEDIAGRQAAYDARAEEAKTAKKSLESAQELLIERVRAFTHPTPLPLFDQAEREQDLADMTESGGDPEPVTEHAGA